MIKINFYSSYPSIAVYFVALVFVNLFMKRFFLKTIFSLLHPVIFEIKETFEGSTF